MGLDLRANVYPQVAVGSDQCPLTASENSSAQAVADNIATVQFVVHPRADRTCSNRERWFQSRSESELMNEVHSASPSAFCITSTSLDCAPQKASDLPLSVISFRPVPGQMRKLNECRETGVRKIGLKVRLSSGNSQAF